MPKSLFWICALYVGLTLSMARGFPPVNSDEVVRAVMGQEWMHHEPARYSLYDDIFAPSVYPMRDVLPGSFSFTLYHAWLGLWTNMRPSSVMMARLSTIVAGVFALLMFYGVGARLGGPRVGLWSAILAGFNPLFLTASCIARPETLLLATFTGVLWLALAFPERIGLKPFLLGALGMLQMSIHPNASVLCAGLFVFYVLRLPTRDRLSKGALFIGGALAGLLIAFLMVDAQRLWLGMHTVHSYLLRPPFIAEPWKMWNWLHETILVMWTGQTFYFDKTTAPGWPICLQLWWVMMCLLGLIAGMQAWKKKSTFEFQSWPRCGHHSICFHGCSR